MYVDENGNYSLRENLTNPSNRFLCLTGVIMRLSTHDKLEQQLGELKLRYFGSKKIVLHRREIVSGKPPFEVLRNEGTRDYFNADMLKLFSDLEYRVISVLIDKKAHVDKYKLRAQDPYALALEYLMQRYQYWLQDYAKKFKPIFGDILAESRGGREDRITKETHKFIYEGEGFNRLRNASQYFSSKEIKLRKKKDNIAGLQLVDLISHPARRHILSQNNLAQNLDSASFAQEVVNILVAQKFRRDKSGQIDGHGTVFFPK